MLQSGWSQFFHRFPLSSPLSKTLKDVSCILIVFGIMISFSFIFVLWPAGTHKSTRWQVFFSCKSTPGLVVRTGLGDSALFQIPREIICLSFSRSYSGLCTYHLVICSNYYYYYYYYYTIFHTSVSWWYLTGVIVGHLKSQGPFSIFWLILIMV